MFEYNFFANIPTNLLAASIEEYFPVITKGDITKGYFVRYFTRQSNHKAGEILEINETTYNRLVTNSLYQVISLEWKIVGALDDTYGIPHINSPTRLTTGVLTANKMSLDAAEKEMPGLQYKLLHLSQFWIGR